LHTRPARRATTTADADAHPQVIHISDADVERMLAPRDVLPVLRQAFIDFARGEAAMQPRLRTDSGPVKLSTLGAVLPRQGYAGAKVYTTIAGRFSFVILLFSSESGAPLATLDANAITRLRTAAVSVLAAQRGAQAGASTLALFGTGSQARAHLEAFADAFALREVRIVSRGDAGPLARHARERLGCDARACDALAALHGADLIVTATRASVPLFDGRLVAPGAFVAAVGSSRPDTRELDDALIGRAARIVVEWREQTAHEAGDLLLADPGVLDWTKVIELGALLDGRIAARTSGDDIVLLKSVGVGLEDIAVAGLAYERVRARS